MDEGYVLISKDHYGCTEIHRVYNDEDAAQKSAKILNAGRPSVYSPSYYVVPVEWVSD